MKIYEIPKKKLNKIGKCDLCKRSFNEMPLGITYILIFYGMDSLRVCKECELSLEKQIHENLIYIWENAKQKK